MNPLRRNPWVRSWSGRTDDASGTRRHRSHAGQRSDRRDSRRRRRGTRCRTRSGCGARGVVCNSSRGARRATGRSTGRSTGCDTGRRTGRRSGRCAGRRGRGRAPGARRGHDLAAQFTLQEGRRGDFIVQIATSERCTLRAGQCGACNPYARALRCLAQAVDHWADGASCALS